MPKADEVMAELHRLEGDLKDDTTKLQDSGMYDVMMLCCIFAGLVSVSLRQEHTALVALVFGLCTQVYARGSFSNVMLVLPVFFYFVQAIVKSLLA